MEKLLIIDGNSIINRAFYGIMGNKMLITSNGTYTNAVYGFLAILFKELEEIKPEYIAVAFDLKAPTKRHILYDKYKANRHGMPDELAGQLPILKNVLKAMNIEIIEKEGYEADDILGTLSRFGEKNGLESILLTGDRDSFQLINDYVKVRIPRTKNGKTETETYNVEKIQEEYGLNPTDLVEVKGLMGDTSDNIPGVPGVGEKTALNLIQKYKTIDNIYNNIEEQKGKLKEKLEEGKDLAYLSKNLGTIDINAPIDVDFGKIKLKEWNKQEVLKLFKELRFNRYIERFNLTESDGDNKTEKQNNIDIPIIKLETEENIEKEILNSNKMFYYIDNTNTYLYSENDIKVYYTQTNNLKDLFEDNSVLKIGYNQKNDYIQLKEIELNPQNFMFDIEIAAYLLNSTVNKYSLEYLANEYMNIDLEVFSNVNNNEQLNLFDNVENNANSKIGINVFLINKLYYILKEKLEIQNQLSLFNDIEMPISEVLAEMQYKGMFVDKEELINYGNEIKEQIEILTKEIYELTGEEFNINSTKQLGEVLFEKLKLTVIKKNKTGYSTDVDVLEKLKFEHPVIEKILEYRQLQKLNSTYVEGLIPYIKEDRKNTFIFSSNSNSNRKN